MLCSNPSFVSQLPTPEGVHFDLKDTLLDICGINFTLVEKQLSDLAVTGFWQMVDMVREPLLGIPTM